MGPKLQKLNKTKRHKFNKNNRNSYATARPIQSASPAEVSTCVSGLRNFERNESVFEDFNLEKYYQNTQKSTTISKEIEYVTLKSEIPVVDRSHFLPTHNDINVKRESTSLQIVDASKSLYPENSFPFSSCDTISAKHLTITGTEDLLQAVSLTGYKFESLTDGVNAPLFLDTDDSIGSMAIICTKDLLSLIWKAQNSSAFFSNDKMNSFEPSCAKLNGKLNDLPVYPNGGPKLLMNTSVNSIECPFTNSSPGKLSPVVTASSFDKASAEEATVDINGGSKLSMNTSVNTIECPLTNSSPGKLSSVVTASSFDKASKESATVCTNGGPKLSMNTSVNSMECPFTYSSHGKLSSVVTASSFHKASEEEIVDINGGSKLLMNTSVNSIECPLTNLSPENVMCCTNKTSCVDKSLTTELSNSTSIISSNYEDILLLLSLRKKYRCKQYETEKYWRNFILNTSKPFLNFIYSIPEGPIFQKGKRNACIQRIHEKILDEAIEIGFKFLLQMDDILKYIQKNCEIHEKALTEIFEELEKSASDCKIGFVDKNWKDLAIKTIFKLRQLDAFTHKKIADKFALMLIYAEKLYAFSKIFK